MTRSTTEEEENMDLAITCPACGAHDPSLTIDIPIPFHAYRNDYGQLEVTLEEFPDLHPYELDDDYPAMCQECSTCSPFGRFVEEV